MVLTLEFHLTTQNPEILPALLRALINSALGHLNKNTVGPLVVGFALYCGTGYYYVWKWLHKAKSLLIDVVETYMKVI